MISHKPVCCSPSYLHKFCQIRIWDGMSSKLYARRRNTTRPQTESRTIQCVNTWRWTNADKARKTPEAKTFWDLHHSANNVPVTETSHCGCSVVEVWQQAGSEQYKNNNNNYNNRNPYGYSWNKVSYNIFVIEKLPFFIKLIIHV